ALPAGSAAAAPATPRQSAHPPATTPPHSPTGAVTDDPPATPTHARSPDDPGAPPWRTARPAARRCSPSPIRYPAPGVTVPASARYAGHHPHKSVETACAG